MDKNNNHSNSVVKLNGVTKSYDGKKVISQLDLSVNHGEFLTLLGPSGCGKTTVLRIIAGFESVDQGQVLLDGENITDMPSEIRPVNTVFQSYALFPHMTVFDNVAFGLKMQKLPKEQITERVMEALQMVRLETMAQRRPHQLSGGQQQRIAIARAVINKPKVLLLDEPLSALDYKLRKEMQLELKQLQRKLGITFVFVTHDQEEALSMSDRIIVLKDGVIQQIGTPREVYEEPCNLFVARFIGEINQFSATVIERLDEKRLLTKINGTESVVFYANKVEKGETLQVLIRPEDLRLKEIPESENTGLTGHVIERTYKGVTLDSIVELESGEKVMVSEFFNEDDPDMNHSIGQKVVVTWVESWEMVLKDDNA